jgi:hypothetical protein
MRIVKMHKTPKPEQGTILTNNEGKPIGIVLSHSENDTILVGLAQDEEEIQEVKEEDVKQHCQVHPEDSELIKKLKEAKIKARLNERVKLIKAKKAYYDSVGWASDYK